MIALILATVGGFATVDIADTTINTNYPVNIGTFDAGASAAGALVTGLSVADLELDLYEAGANGAWIGIGDGTAGDVIIVPFDAAGFGPPGYYVANDASWDISSYGLTLDVNGQIQALTMFGYPLFGGGDAGVWESGLLTIEYSMIPAPGILAILGLAGIAFTSSRKRAH